MKAPCIAVAYSGGRDSTALLHATLTVAAGCGVRVVACHVHHGLHPQASQWVRHVRRQCKDWAARGWSVELRVHRVAEGPPPGCSVEAWARERRYQALACMAAEHGCDIVLLAHHRRDQAETFVLQALRGAGAAGLAAMPASIERMGVQWVRPWLAWPREAIESYIDAHGLTCVDDPSNKDPRFARNRLRTSVWPALSESFPDAELSLSRCAAWAHQASVCLDELAEIDLDQVADQDVLKIPAWLQLSVPRRVNVLRAWLKSMWQAAPASLVVRLADELPTSAAGRWEVAGGALRRQHDQLRFVPAKAALLPDARPLASSATVVRLTRAGRYVFKDWGGCLTVRRVKADGVPLAWLSHAVLRARSGGESFQAGPGRPARSLKRQFQAAGVPSWQRDAPLLFSGEHLVFVPGLGIDARMVGLPGQALVSLDWERLEAPRTT